MFVDDLMMLFFEPSPKTTASSGSFMAFLFHSTENCYLRHGVINLPYDGHTFLCGGAVIYWGGECLQLMLTKHNKLTTFYCFRNNKACVQV